MIGVSPKRGWMGGDEGPSRRSREGLNTSEAPALSWLLRARARHRDAVTRAGDRGGGRAQGATGGGDWFGGGVADGGATTKPCVLAWAKHGARRLRLPGDLQGGFGRGEGRSPPGSGLLGAQCHLWVRSGIGGDPKRCLKTSLGLELSLVLKERRVEGGEGAGEREREQGKGGEGGGEKGGDGAGEKLGRGRRGKWGRGRKGKMEQGKRGEREQGKRGEMERGKGEMEEEEVEE